MKFRFIRDVTDASGWQAFVVEADSLEQAKELAVTDGGEFDFEEVEVYGLGEPDPGSFEQVHYDYLPGAELCND